MVAVRVRGRVVEKVHTPFGEGRVQSRIGLGAQHPAAVHRWSWSWWCLAQCATYVPGHERVVVDQSDPEPGPPRRLCLALPVRVDARPP